MTFFPLRNPDGVTVLFNNGEVRALDAGGRRRIDMLSADHNAHWIVEVRRDIASAIRTLVDCVAPKGSGDRARAERLGQLVSNGLVG